MTHPTLTRTNAGIKYDMPTNLSPNELETYVYAATVYGSLLAPRAVTTGNALADRIDEVYDCNKATECKQVLRKARV